MINPRVGSVMKGSSLSSGKARSGTIGPRGTQQGMKPGNGSQARPAMASGVGAKGNNTPLANMPAKNTGKYPVKMGSGIKSQLNNKLQQPGNQVPKGANQKTPGVAGKPNMPANNVTNNGPALGTTMHTAGTVPKYLRGGAVK